MLKYIVLCVLLLNVIDAQISVSVFRRSIPEFENNIVERTAENIKIGGNLDPKGLFWATVGLGTPAQNFSLILDTGSSGLLVESKGCVAGCLTNTSTWFNPAASSSFSKVGCSGCAGCWKSNQYGFINSSCEYASYYGIGNVYSIGTTATDNIVLGSESGAGAYFGLMLNNSGMISVPDIQGIFGLAYNYLSPFNSPRTPLDQFMLNTLTYNSFSLCLLPSNGNFRVGDSWSSDPRVKWTPILTNGGGDNDYYRMKVNTLTLGSRNIATSSATICNPFCIVDSGTTLIYLPSAPFNNFKNLLMNCTFGTLPGTCGAQAGQSLFDGYCYSMTAKQLASYPTLSVSIDGISSPVPVPPSVYFINQSPYWCMGIAQANGLPTIFGATFMQGFNVIFDRNTSKIGFANTTTCNSAPQDSTGTTTGTTGVTTTGTTGTTGTTDGSTSSTTGNSDGTTGNTDGTTGTTSMVSGSTSTTGTGASDANSVNVFGNSLSTSTQIELAIGAVVAFVAIVAVTIFICKRKN